MLRCETQSSKKSLKMGSCKRPNNRQKNMNRRAVFGRRRLLFFFLFALNSLFLSVYFFRSISDHSPPISPPEFHESPVSENQTDLTVPFSGKPWPVIPSFIPWSPTPNLSHKSCEAYFGNGFNHRVDLLRSPENSRNRADPAGKLPGGWFRCFYSETLESSICEGGRIRMNPAKIRMSDGGESLELVIGRREAEELPSFEPGAFEIELAAENRQNAGGKVASSEFLNRFVPQGVVRIHTMRALLDSIRVVESDKFYCSQWIEDPTLLVTRFEYANLFHTITDWYSAYVASRVTGLPSRPHLVFVDGHCKSPLEETWEALFSSLRYAKNFSSPVCFRHVILSPLGYETALFKGLTETINCQGAPASELRENTNMHKTSRLSEFGEMVGASFGLPLRVPKPVLTHNVLFVRREDYQAHPRHSGKVESRLSNEKEVFDSLKTWSGANHLRCTVNLVDGLFAHMSMKDQVRAIQEASVIIGAHGAGLTHIVAASPSAVVLEIISSQYRRPHFALISEWRGLEYHAINLPGSDADPAEVITKLSNIMESLGC